MKVTASMCMYVDGQNLPVQIYEGFPKPPSGPVGLEAYEEEKPPSSESERQKNLSHVGLGKITYTKVVYPSNQAMVSDTSSFRVSPSLRKEAHRDASAQTAGEGNAERRKSEAELATAALRNPPAARDEPWSGRQAHARSAWPPGAGADTSLLDRRKDAAPRVNYEAASDGVCQVSPPANTPPRPS